MWYIVCFIEVSYRHDYFIAIVKDTRESWCIEYTLFRVPYSWSHYVLISGNEFSGNIPCWSLDSVTRGHVLDSITETYWFVIRSLSTIYYISHYFNAQMSNCAFALDSWSRHEFERIGRISRRWRWYNNWKRGLLLAVWRSFAIWAAGVAWHLRNELDCSMNLGSRLGLMVGALDTLASQVLNL